MPSEFDSQKICRKDTAKEDLTLLTNGATICKWVKVVSPSGKKRQEETTPNNLEMRGIEPLTFRMRSGRSTTELHPLNRKKFQLSQPL